MGGTIVPYRRHTFLAKTDSVELRENIIDAVLFQLGATPGR